MEEADIPFSVHNWIIEQTITGWPTRVFSSENWPISKDKPFKYFKIMMAGFITVIIHQLCYKISHMQTILQYLEAQEYRQYITEFLESQIILH